MSDNEKPWLNEPDSLRFIDELTGLECYIWRHPALGSLNGYVIIPKNNKLYGIYDGDEILNNIEVHGGITFSGIRKEIDEYAIGFDCSHAGDLSPKMSSDILAYLGDTYKDIEFVKAECRSLAKQLFELSKEYQSTLNETYNND